MSIFVLVIILVLIILYLTFLMISSAKKLKNRPITTSYVCNYKLKHYRTPVLIISAVISIVAIIFPASKGWEDAIAPVAIYSFLVALIVSSEIAYLVSVIQRINEKKYQHISIAGPVSGKALCEGWASINGNNGWMFLTKNSFELYLYPVLVSRQSVVINLRSINQITNKRSTFIITTDEGEFRIKVKCIKMWKKYIKEALSSNQQ